MTESRELRIPLPDLSEDFDVLVTYRLEPDGTPSITKVQEWGDNDWSPLNLYDRLNDLQIDALNTSLLASLDSDDELSGESDSPDEDEEE